MSSLIRSASIFAKKGEGDSFLDALGPAGRYHKMFIAISDGVGLPSVKS